MMEASDLNLDPNDSAIEYHGPSRYMIPTEEL